VCRLSKRIEENSIVFAGYHEKLVLLEQKHELECDG
jgi:hypothetical protein